MKCIKSLMIFLTFFFKVIFAKYLQGELKTTEKWAFVERFCFLSDDGVYEFDIEYDLDYAPMNLLLYYDSPTQWPSVYKSDKTCEEREAVMLRENNQIINLTQAAPGSECEVLRTDLQKPYYRCRGIRTFRSARERWWFIAISNCKSNKGLSLKYKLTMTNGYNFWYKHFSADEFFMLRTDMVAFAIQTGIFFLSILSSVELKKRQLFHTTYRLYMFALVCQIFGILFLIMYYWRYGYYGISFPATKLVGRILTSTSTVIMVLLLLLIAKGFTITRGRLRQASAVKLTVFMCFFCITYATLFIYEQNFFDPGEVLYLYESPPGYGLMALRWIGWLMFLYACFFTVKHYPEKASFYYPFFTFYTFWFVSGPIVIIISNHVIDKWVREKVVNGVDLGITILGHLFFLFLTRPNASNKNFPYHVRTSQITSMEESFTGRAQGGTLDAFNAHMYSPDLPDEPKNFTSPDLFLVSGAFEMRPIRGGPIIKDDQSFPHYTPEMQSSLFRTPENNYNAKSLAIAP